MTPGYSDTVFLARIVESRHTPSNPIVFDDAVLNTGGHYDPTTGIYTAPINGTYEFIVHIQSTNDYYIKAHLVVDNTEVSTLVDEDMFC